MVHTLAGIVIFGGGGFLLLFRAKEIQRIAIRRQDSSVTGKLNPFGGFVRRSSYVSMLRLFGLLCVMAALVFVRLLYQRVR